MTRLKTIDSSKITWTIYPGDEGCSIRTFCADGDGIVTVEEHADNVYSLYDQNDRLQTWHGVETPEQILAILEVAQAHLEANYSEVYESAMHWNDDNDQDLFNHLNNIKG
jgi:hypothetical protein